MDMDYIREFDIRLEKEMYYAGETLSGHVILDTVENFKLRAIRVVLRGKAHTEWKVVVSGDRRTVKDDQYFIDDRAIIWGKEKAEGSVPILPRGMHQFPFRFQLPESSLPCSFESRAGTIRYYIKVTVDIPYASPPQGMKYFTIIGPHIDCMDDQYLKPMIGQAKRTTCCFCCQRSPIVLKTQLERSAYVCGESLRVKAEIDNQTEEEARLKLKLVQYVEYYIDRGVLGVTKEVSHTILEYRGAPIPPHTRTKWDSAQTLVVSTMPPTLLGVCRLMQIYYLLKVNVELEKAGEDLHMHFPITIATVPFRIPNSQQQPAIHYEVASDHVEGGMYIGPEFQLGQVYDGGLDTSEAVVLYRPVYVCVQSHQQQLQQQHSTTSRQATTLNSSSSTTSNIDSTKSPNSNKKVVINHGESSGSVNKVDINVISPRKGSTTAKQKLSNNNDITAKSTSTVKTASVSSTVNSISTAASTTSASKVSNSTAAAVTTSKASSISSSSNAAAIVDKTSNVITSSSSTNVKGSTVITSIASTAKTKTVQSSSSSIISSTTSNTSSSSTANALQNSKLKSTKEDESLDSSKKVSTSSEKKLTKIPSTSASVLVTSSTKTTTTTVAADTSSSATASSSTK